MGDEMMIDLMTFNLRQANPSTIQMCRVNRKFSQSARHLGCYGLLTFCLCALRGKLAFVETVTELTNHLVASYARVAASTTLDDKNCRPNASLPPLRQDSAAAAVPRLFDENRSIPRKSRWSRRSCSIRCWARLEDETARGPSNTTPRPSAETEHHDGRPHSLTVAFLRQPAPIREILQTDWKAAYDGDPAAKSREEYSFSYPFIEAIAVQRLAHELYLKDVA